MAPGEPTPPVRQFKSGRGSSQLRSGLLESGAVQCLPPPDVRKTYVCGLASPSEGITVSSKSTAHRDPSLVPRCIRLGNFYLATWRFSASLPVKLLFRNESDEECVFF